MKDLLIQLAKWRLQAPWQSYLAFLFAIALTAYLPVQQSLEQFTQWQQLEQQTAQTEQQLSHQRQILHTLKNKAEQALLTPELANQLLPVNQQIQQLARHGLQLQNSQWEFHQAPLLNLELQGHFRFLHQFIQQLLQQNPQVALTRLQIQKIEPQGEATSASINSEMQFKLDLQPQLAQQSQSVSQ